MKSSQIISFVLGLVSIYVYKNLQYFKELFNFEDPIIELQAKNLKEFIS